MLHCLFCIFSRKVSFFAAYSSVRHTVPSGWAFRFVCGSLLVRIISCAESAQFASPRFSFFHVSSFSRFSLLLLLLVAIPKKNGNWQNYYQIDFFPYGCASIYIYFYCRVDFINFFQYAYAYVSLTLSGSGSQRRTGYPSSPTPALYGSRQKFLLSTPAVCEADGHHFSPTPALPLITHCLVPL